MKKETILNRILRSNQTVFSFKEILLAADKTIHAALLKRQIHYYVQKGEVYPLRRGLYAKSEHYDKFELATKIYTPSYISFETVLGAAGVTFQFYSQVFVASYLSRQIIVDGKTYTYKKIKDTVLTNAAGIEQKKHYAIASPERAFLDAVYLYHNYHFDHLTPLNWDKIDEILPIYRNQQMNKHVADYYKEYKQLN